MQNVLVSCLRALIGIKRPAAVQRKRQTRVVNSQPGSCLKLGPWLLDCQELSAAALAGWVVGPLA